MAEYEWDPAKAASNHRKHGIHFADAVGVFEDDRAITIGDNSADEQRFKTLGTDFLGRILVVAYTYRAQIYGCSQRGKPPLPNARSTRGNDDHEEER